MKYILFFVTVPSFYPGCYSRWVCVNLTTVLELSLEVVGPSKIMRTSLLSEDLRFMKRLGEPRYTGVIAAVGRNSVILRATVSGEVLSDKHRSLQHLQREYHGSGQAMKPVLTSSDRSYHLNQQTYFRRWRETCLFPEGHVFPCIALVRTSLFAGCNSWVS